MIKMPSASSLERASACPGSCHLPQIDCDSENADKGRAGHAYFENLGKGMSMPEALKKAGKWAPLFSLVDVDALPIGSGFLHEVKLVYNIETGRCRRVNLPEPRDYGPLGEFDIPGSIDVLGVQDEAVVVVDFKFGSHVTALAENLQLQFYCMAAAALFSRERAIAMLAFIREDGSSYLETAEWDEFDLLAFKKRIAAVWMGVKLATKDKLSEGKHCRYCPAYSQCPAKMTLALALGNRTLMERWEAKALEGAVVDAYKQWKHAKEIVDRIGQAIFGYARNHPIDLGGGVILAEKETERRSLDGALAWDVISSLHGPEVARQAVTVEASFTSIREALLPLSDKAVKEKKISVLERQVESALEASGAIRVKKSTKVCEQKKKEDK